MTDDNSFSLVVSFPDQSHSFTHGFQAGEIWSRMERGESVIDLGFEEGFPAHTPNIEVIRRMASHFGYAVRTQEESVEGWTPMLLTLEPKTKPALKLVLGGVHDDR